jgi:hypothetical protein
MELVMIRSNSLKLAVFALIVIVTLASRLAMADDSAMSQLQRTGNGSQHTGQTFDGSGANSQRGTIDTRVRSR